MAEYVGLDVSKEGEGEAVRWPQKEYHEAIRHTRRRRLRRRPCSRRRQKARQSLTREPELDNQRNPILTDFMGASRFAGLLWYKHPRSWEAVAVVRSSRLWGAIRRRGGGR